MLVLFIGHYGTALICIVILCLDESQFELVDEKVEKLFDFHLKESLCRAREKRLFRVNMGILYGYFC